jgi:hypothetical protein
MKLICLLANLIFLSVLFIVLPKQALSVEYKFLEGKQSKIFESVYDTTGKLVKSSRVLIADTEKESFVWVNACSGSALITAINHWEGHKLNYLVMIKNNRKQVIYSSEIPLGEYSMNKQCDKIALLIENYRDNTVYLQVINMKGEILNVLPLDNQSGWFLSKQAWLGKDDIVLTRVNEHKAVIVTINIVSGKQQVIGEGKGPVVFQNYNKTEVIYAESNKIMAFHTNKSKKRIICEFPSNYKIGFIRIIPHTKVLVFQMSYNKNDRIMTKTIIFDRAEQKEIEIALDNIDFIPLRP